MCLAISHFVWRLLPVFEFYESGTSNPISINWGVYLDDFDSVEGFKVLKTPSLAFAYTLNVLNNTTVTEDASYINGENLVIDGGMTVDTGAPSYSAFLNDE